MTVNRYQSSVLFQRVTENGPQEILRCGLGSASTSFFEGLHAFSHTHFCPAALWFRFSESLANLGRLYVRCSDLTQPRPLARITFASAQQSLWQLLFRGHIQEM